MKQVLKCEGEVNFTCAVPNRPSSPRQGSFIDFDCGAHCDDASLDWSEGGYYYGISLKAGDKKTLVRIGNSAIAAGHGKTVGGTPLIE